MERSDDSVAKLPADAKAFLDRILDDLHSDENHVSIFASVAIGVITLIFFHIIMNFLGSIGHLLDKTIITTDIETFVFIIGTAIVLITTTISIFSIYIIIRVRRHFIHSYRDTEEIIREGFKRALF